MVLNRQCLVSSPETDTTCPEVREEPFFISGRVNQSRARSRDVKNKSGNKRENKHFSHNLTHGRT